MSVTTRTVTTATPLYPGSLFAEDGRSVEIPNNSPETALAAIEDDGRWFALEIRTTEQKRWTDGDGGELWRPTGQPASYRVYLGETLTAGEIEQLPDAYRYSILLSNMRGNGWERVVRTRRDNFQPMEPGDVVVPQRAEAAR